MMRGFVAVLAGMLASTAIAQQAPHTVQQDFDAAAALDVGTDHAAALQAWEALEKRTAGNKRSHALVLVRKSAALLALDRKDEAVAAARAGLAAMPSSDPTLRADRFLAYLDLGKIAEIALDYASAAEAYREAEAVADAPADKLTALFGTLRTQTFVDPAATAAAAARADALAAQIKVADKIAGELAMREAVLALNRGDIAAAQKLSGRSVALMGGLTEKTDLRDVSARSTAAIAALLAGKRDDARRYMAMTGAGRLNTGTFDPAVQMKVPDCGGEAGLKPADFAVVEFSIGSDGSVPYAAPVYAVGGGAVALEFARTARSWSWTPEQVKALPAFFRNNARIELRCSTAFERPSLGSTMLDATAAWIEGKGGTLPAEREGADAAELPHQRAALAAADARDPTGIAAFAALYRLLDNSVVGREERAGFVTRALAIATAMSAPPMVRLPLAIAAGDGASAEKWRPGTFRRIAALLLADPLYANDPQARATLRLFLVDSIGKRDVDERRTLLRQVGADAGLAKNDPLRVGALVRLASIEAQEDQAAAARAAFEQSGLAANQCAIIDSPPAMLHVGGTFPEEAMQWGFEGWTRTQFDIAADGRVTNERAIMSYPPFIFTAAGTKTIAGARYAKSYRPDGGLGCGAQVQKVKFVMPH